MAQLIAFLLHTQRPQVRFLAYPSFFQEKIVNVVEVNRRRCLMKKGQWGENDD